MNPILKKELKIKMRSWKVVAVMMIYLLALGGLILLMSSNIFMGYGSGYGIRPEEISTIFIFIVMAQLGLILLIAPATTANSISGERERGTLDLLICTRMSSLSLVVGKLLASIAEVVLLLIVSIPVLSIIFLFGGISLSNILLIFIFYVITAILFGSIGIFMSSFFKKTTTSTIMSYFVTALLAGGTVFIVLAMEVFYFRPNGVSGFLNSFPKILYLNPFVVLLGVLDSFMGQGMLTDIFGLKGSTKLIVINMLFSIITSMILLYLSSIKINPMKGLKSKNK
ncbi:ABC transporter permease [Tissierella creatinophila]|uniref:ABC-2 family transporter protein n=1 Tax=Tissierella creatinophila DSM 6911 TaxID=1123403 RepID=A0A1U7M7S8_TISCR|nr:ABC transporter permease subunit [Tissierella creatinophila]OLS03269.1 ABC-2 family transporter protein [Tissierella creatinophila DSM 6911]